MLSGLGAEGTRPASSVSAPPAWRRFVTSAGMMWALLGRRAARIEVAVPLLVKHALTNRLEARLRLSGDLALRPFNEEQDEGEQDGLSVVRTFGTTRGVD